MGSEGTKSRDAAHLRPATDGAGIIAVPLCMFWTANIPTFP